MAARYWPLMHEMNFDDLNGPWHYLGGEVELVFEHRAPVRLTWDENAGWAEHFSLQVVASSACVPGSLELLDASASPLWKPIIGTVVSSIKVFGLNNTPIVVVFQFDSNAVLVGAVTATATSSCSAVATT